jgi:toxin ParE1/3/4
MKRYLIHPLATQDLDEIATYLGDINLEASDRFLQEFDRRCVQLVAFPMSGKAYPQLRDDLRGISFKGYIIFYRLLKG